MTSFLIFEIKYLKPANVDESRTARLKIRQNVKIFINFVNYNKNML